MTFSLTNNFFGNARGLTFLDSGNVSWTFNKTTNQITATAAVPVPGSANPTASVGLTAVNGAAGTYMRSDAAPALDVTIAPTWTGDHTWTASAGTPMNVNGVPGSYTAIFTGGATAGTSRGVKISAGTNASDLSFVVTNAAATINYLVLDGSGVTTLNGQPNSDTLVVRGSNTTGQSYGIDMFAGSTSVDYAMKIRNVSGTTVLFQVNGDGTVKFATQSSGYGTPTGGAKQPSFAAGAITLPNLAAAVAQLILDLKTTGLLAT